MRRNSMLTAYAMMALGIGLVGQVEPRKKRYVKPTIVKVEKESRQVRRARERQAAKRSHR